MAQSTQSDKEADIALNCARAYLQSSNYGRAFDSFYRFLKLQPEQCKDVYYEFGLVTRKWCELLEQQNKIEELFKCFRQACEAYRDHDTILNNIGAQLFRLGYIEEAAAYIRRSLIVNPDYLAARHNLENVCSHLVERWHFTMLNDKRRNVAYKFAIDKAIKSGYDTVLDIGTGTGILSLMCEFSGARQVTACDRSRAMIEVARDVLQENLAQDSIKLVHKSSTEMKVPEDMEKKVRLLVTETFDAGLFGENIVSTLSHAWKNLISTSPMGTVIPCGATMYVCGIECDAIRSQNRMMYPVLQHLDLSMVDIHCSTGQLTEDPYTTENLSTVRGGYKILTNISELLRINFCNLCELESLHKGKEWQSSLFVKQHGRLDALAVWFDLHLDDTVTIGTGADGGTCWEQAIYPVTSVLQEHQGDKGGHENCHLKKREKLKVTFHFKQDCLRLQQCEVVSSLPCRHSNQKSSPKGQAPDGSGVSMKDCSSSNLPFRKRKVDTKLSEESLGVDEKETYSCKEMNCVTSKTNELPSKASDTCIKGQNTCDSEDITHEADITDSCTQQVETADLSESPNCHQNLTTSQDETQNCDNVQCSDSPDDTESVTSDNIRLNCGTSTDSKIPSQAEQCFDTMNLEKDLKMNLNLGHHSTQMSKDCVKPTASSSDSQMHDPDRSMTLTSGRKDGTWSFFTEREDIGFLNDIQLNKAYCQTLETYLSRQNTQKVSCLIITSRLSFLAIQAAKMGYSPVAMVTREENHATIKKVAALNGCKTGEITLLDLMDLGDMELKADVIMFDVVEPVGILRQQVLEDMVLQKFQNLTVNGVILPSKLTIHGLFIESELLEGQSRVINNEKTLGLQIAQHMNVFQMQNHANIDLSLLPHRKLSEVFKVFEIDFQALSPKNWFKTQQQAVEKSVEMINSGQITALVYWFELTLGEDSVVNTLDARCHWKQAAVMLKGDNPVIAGQTLLTKVTVQASCLDVTVVTTEAANGFYHSAANGLTH